jgi:hypothetical protein
MCGHVLLMQHNRIVDQLAIDVIMAGCVGVVGFIISHIGWQQLLTWIRSLQRFNTITIVG